jgi:DNA-binding CsgD family transcriptional regulator
VGLIVLATYLVVAVTVALRHPSHPSLDLRAVRSETLSLVIKGKNLSPRETEVLWYLVNGRSATYIARELTISAHTVKTHIKRIYGKLDVHSKQELLDLLEKQTDSQRGQGPFSRDTNALSGG